MAWLLGFLFKIITSQISLTVLKGKYRQKKVIQSVSSVAYTHKETYSSQHVLEKQNQKQATSSEYFYLLPLDISQT